MAYYPMVAWKLIHRWKGKQGECRYCTGKERLKQRLGMKHPMLPNLVWHGISGWKWTSGYGVVNRKAVLRVEKRPPKEGGLDG